MLHHRKVFLFTSLCYASSQVGCTNGDKKWNDTYAVHQSKDDKKQKKSKTIKKLDNEVSLNEIVKRLITTDGQWLATDERVLVALPRPVEKNSLEEAGLALGLLYKLQALSTQQATQQYTLENLAQNNQIDFLSAFRDNPYLDNYQTISLTLKNCQEGNNSEAFTSKLKTLIQNKVQKWVTLQDQVHVAFQEAPTVEPIQEENLTQTNPKTAPSASPSPAIVPVEAPTGAAPGQTDMTETFTQADTFISQANFSEAIAILSKVTPDHHQYEFAQEKIKNTSNLAVQELRLKAAKSFQASLPVADKKAQKAYLVDAQKYLEEALVKYPHANQIQTVKQNLEVIKKNLAQMEIPQDKLNANPTSP